MHGRRGCVYFQQQKAEDSSQENHALGELPTLPIGLAGHVDAGNNAFFTHLDF
jgi:hypothetical protein